MKRAPAWAELVGERARDPPPGAGDDLTVPGIRRHSDFLTIAVSPLVAWSGRTTHEVWDSPGAAATRVIPEREALARGLQVRRGAWRAAGWLRSLCEARLG